MASYTDPGVYVENVASGAQSITQLGSSVGMLIGVTPSGPVNVAKKIGSWKEYIDKYANGLETPFLANDYLSYAVYGFFTNGGRELYIGSVKKNGVKATKTTEESKVTVTAAYEGAWGNSIKVEIKINAGYVADTNEVYDVTVSVGTEDSASFSEVTKEEFKTVVLANSKVKNWLSVFTVAGTLGNSETITLAGGSDGAALTDADYEKALEMADTIDDLTMIAIPGQTSNVVNAALIAYSENHKLFPMLDFPLDATVEEAKAYRKSISAWTGAIFYPWGKMNDPLTNELKAVPCAGHAMGMYARFLASGVRNAPAGVTAVIRGFVEMEYVCTAADRSILNPVGVVCVIPKTNAGIVAWGARGLNSTDSTMRYVTDGLINLMIDKSLFDGTQFAVFLPNNEKTWTKVRTACESFLITLWNDGTLVGDTQEEAFYVICDSTNNTADSIADGIMYIDVGYAPFKPAEFIVIRLAHSIQSA